MNRKAGLFLLMLSILTLTSGFETVSASVDSHVVSSIEEMQQNPLTLRGVISDASTGEPLIGANVIEKGTTNGTVTNSDGSFRLDVQSNRAVLVISYIGYQTVEVPASGNLNISLSEDTELMEELVVIGYGTQRKGDVTSAISSVKAEDFTVGKIGDAADLIKGKIAGLTISKGSGDPNHGSTIRLRGVISLEGSSTPLVLIDGIEGNLGTVAPENIASIDVLKDASAAAIYGTRGANGVILITTKSGNRGAGTVA
ncbi:MAG: carboxypeptidase-like regulatory domain-containing protein, partial [Proteiniphilum sp.]|nr:carboxypeptidase-like regulatory domain-containing protein [Proteiniphilum sp.]